MIRPLQTVRVKSAEYPLIYALCGFFRGGLYFSSFGFGSDAKARPDRKQVTDSTEVNLVVQRQSCPISDLHGGIHPRGFGRRCSNTDRCILSGRGGCRPRTLLTIRFRPSWCRTELCGVWLIHSVAYLISPFLRVIKKADRFLISICLCIIIRLCESSKPLTKGKYLFYIYKIVC